MKLYFAGTSRAVPYGCILDVSLYADIPLRLGRKKIPLARIRLLFLNN